jgi:ACR3 family arsenite efflux pump ArsB
MRGGMLRNEGNTALRETHQPEVIHNALEALPAPQGIGMAVAFDWGLAVQVLLTPIAVTFFNPSGSFKLPGVNPTLGNILFFVIAWPIAIGLVLFGEMVRHGRNWTRRIQVVANALLSLVGIIQLYSLYRSVKGGNFWPLVTEVILVIFSPLIFWRMTRPSTARWFKSVTMTEARRRHGGAWPWLIAIWAIVGGVLQTIASFK